MQSSLPTNLSLHEEGVKLSSSVNAQLFFPQGEGVKVSPPYGGTAQAPKLACFVSRNSQHLFEKYYMHLIVNFPRRSKIASKLR